MDMSRFRPESRVPQRSLGHKLRVQQLEDFPNSLNPDLVHVRSVRNDHLIYDPVVLSSGIFHVSSSSNVLPPLRDERQHQELQTAQEHRQILAEEPSFSGLSESNLFKFSATSKFSGDPHDCGNWKSIGYASGLAVWETNQVPRFLGEDVLNNARASNISAAKQYPKPIYGNLLYQNATQDVFTTASIDTQLELEVASHEHQNVREANRGSRMEYCGNQANPMQFGDAGAWMNWRELGFLASKGSLEQRTAASDVTTQGLSLSLSSNPPSKTCAADTAQFTEDQYGFANFHSRPGEFKELQDSQTLTGKANGKSIQDAGGTSSDYVHRQTTPLGPFTGYAIILKNSRFLKPAQELLDELCHFTNSNPFKVSDTSDGISGDINALVSADAPSAVDMDAGTSKGNNSGFSSGTVYSFNESCRPQYQQKKAKLVYMLQEVCRRYKLYHQQMQLVVSSFDSVAGLGAATPYFSSALKTVAKSFRCLRNAILDQIKHLSRALGEDLLSPTTCTSSSKGHINMSRLKFLGQKSGEVLGFNEPQQHGWRPQRQQHGWRPQRGLPERAVAILRAWLFEHFLHPYPTDTDKNMLTIQTGLSRNQVSNWFINARVRVWKPMVEEIHMLESKGLAEANPKLSRSDGIPISEGHNIWPNDEQSDKQLTCSDMLVADIAGDSHDVEYWNHVKRARNNFHTPTNKEGSLMDYAPYEQSKLENGGLGAVSLTLGLRHDVESAQQHQQQYQQQEHHLRRQFGDQLIHDNIAG